MSRIKIDKATAVPTGGAIVANTLYVVAVGGDKIEMYMSDLTGTSLRRMPNEVDIQALIDASVSGLSGVEVVDDISARDALTPTSNVSVYVIDASGDATVNSGGASYIYRSSDSTWFKQSEAESVDIVFNWANLLDKPTSTVAAIDAAVSNSHTHANKTELDLIAQDGDGDMTYNGSKVANEYTTVSW